MQIADVYIASRTLDLAAANAAWRIGAGLDVADDLAVAAYWVGHEAPGAMRTCHHLHGGMGVDITYPMHRYFSWITDISHALGVAGRRRARRGPDDQEPRAHRRAARAQGRAADLLHRPRRRQRAPRHGRWTGTARPTSAWCARWATDGWMGVGWPKEYGGHGLGEIEQTIFANEAQRADVHLPAVTLQTVGPTLIRYGTEKQKDLFLEADPRRATCTSRSATASRTPAPTWRRCGPRPSGTATTTSSTARRCGPPAATRPTTCGSPYAPTRTRPSTRASRS